MIFVFICVFVSNQSAFSSAICIEANMIEQTFPIFVSLVVSKQKLSIESEGGERRFVF